MLLDEIKDNVQSVIDFLKSLPDNQFDFKSGNDAKCGSIACIAGWACYVKAGMPNHAVFFDMEIASSYLGINYEDNSMLDKFFNNDKDIEDVSKQDAIDMLINYKNTGDVTWAPHIQQQIDSWGDE